MLIGLDPLLGPDLLRALRAMGHGDDIALVDANFPGEATARRMIRADGCALVPLLNAVLSVLPIDQSGVHAAAAMEVMGAPARREAIHREIESRLAETATPHLQLHYLERQAFYARASNAFAIVQSGEPRFYGNIILRKGTIGTAS